MATNRNFFQNIFFFNYDSLTTCSLVSCNKSYHSSLCLYVFMIEFRTALIMWYFVVFHVSSIPGRLNSKHFGERAKTGLLGIRIMCLSGTTCPPTECCLSELAL
jgi:hypothetical protein